MFLLVPAYPGCPGSKAVKRSLLLLLYVVSFDSRFSREPDLAVFFHVFWKRTFQDNW